MSIQIVILVLLIKNVQLENYENVSESTKDKKTDVLNYEARNIGVSSRDIFNVLRNMDFKLWSNENTDTSGRKKHLHMAPLIFKMGAASTWLLLTAFLAAKSVVIGLMLLVLKIVLHSAKLASLVSLLKHKHHHKEEYWAWTPPPEYHDHGYGQSSFHHNDYDRTSSSRGTYFDGPRIDSTGWNQNPQGLIAPEWTQEDEEF